MYSSNSLLLLRVRLVIAGPSDKILVTHTGCKVAVYCSVVLCAKVYQSSRNTPQRYFFSSGALLMAFVTRRTRSTVECLVRNPIGRSGMSFTVKLLTFFIPPGLVERRSARPDILLRVRTRFRVTVVKTSEHGAAGALTVVVGRSAGKLLSAATA